VGSDSVRKEQASLVTVTATALSENTWNPDLYNETTYQESVLYRKSATILYLLKS